MKEKNKTVKYTSYPVFDTVSWAIAYYHGSQTNPKFYRDCPGHHLYDLVGTDEDGEEVPGYEDLEFEVVETFSVDGVDYLRFKVWDRFYWMDGERGKSDDV